MKTDNPIVGVNLSGADKFLCEYVDFLSSKLPITTVNNFFVFTARGSFMALQKDTKNKDGKLFLKLLEEEMDKNITPYYKNVKTINNQAVAGLFIESFYHKFDHTKTDLIFIGKDPESNGINGKSIIRHIPASTYIVPQNAKHKLDHVLISIDNTTHSMKVLREALHFCSMINPLPKITVLHILPRPYFGELGESVMENYGNYSDIGMEMLFEEQYKIEKEQFEALVKEQAQKFKQLDIKISVIQDVEKKAYYGVEDYLHHHHIDLAVFGTKSHTSFDANVLGSLVEKTISADNKVPLLIIR